MSAALVIVEPEHVECPTCEGRGEVARRVYRGEYAMEADWSQCGTCGGSGSVAADEVRKCESCAAVYDVELGGCAHADLCPTCGPECRLCLSEAAAEAEADRQYDRIRGVER